MALPKKTTAKGAAKVVSIAESIRVVPLYNPKPELKLADLAKSKDDSELFDDGGTGAPAVHPKLVYDGGPLITNVDVFTIFWGKNWKANASFMSLKDKLNQFFTDILVSPLRNQLAGYIRPVSAIGHGSLSGSEVITAGAPTKSIHDSKIQTTLSSWIAAGTVLK